MNKRNRILLSIIAITLIALLYVYLYIGSFMKFEDTVSIVISASSLLLLGFLINEFVHWIRRGKRAQSMDLVVLGFIFITVFIWTNDVMNSVIGAFSIYLLFGIMELKEYDVLNKILLITVVTYNFIFFAGLINTFLKNAGILSTDVVRDTAFSMSIWVMLILGFILFGRKYLIVFRFMSPQYLSLFLFMIAWLAVRFVSRWWTDITEWIYLLLIGTNWLVYFISGPVLDLMLGIKRTNNQQILDLVDNVKEDLELSDKIKVGFGKYPILNAMAYGAWFDKRIAIISPSIDKFPKDELKGIIAHELSHTKGGIKGIPDTLTLALITTVQLLIFWGLGWPATIYDYTFAPESQPFPIWVFLLINIAISAVLYIFVRGLEGYADLNTKKVGLGNELAKGLYNLEGFYSSGREIGLDTMLLCDEELEKYNRINNYATTAEYLHNNMYKAKWWVLLSNLLNSHPPTYHRIISMYSDEENQLSPWRESILPFSLMFKGKSKKFRLEYQSARDKYEEMANHKFKQMFNIDSYTDYMSSLNKAELYEHRLNKRYLFIDHYHLEVGTGILKQVKFEDNVASPNVYVINVDSDKTDQTKMNAQSNSEQIVLRAFNGLFTELVPINVGSRYQYKSSTVLKLVDIVIPADLKTSFREKTDIILKKNEISSQDIKEYMNQNLEFHKSLKKDAYYLFKSDDSVKKLPLSKKMKFDLSILDEMVDKDIFLQDGGTLKILKFQALRKNKNYVESELIILNERYDYLFNESDNQIARDEEKSFILKDLVIQKHEFSFIFHNDEITGNYEREMLRFLSERKLRTTFYLKKPINNQETGYITALNISSDSLDDSDSIQIESIYGHSIDIPLSKIEVVVFGEETFAVRNKNKMSFGERIGHKIRKWRKPYALFYT